MTNEMVIERWRLRIRQVGARVKIEAQTTTGWRALETLPLDDDWQHDEVVSLLHSLANEYAEFLEDYRESRWPEPANQRALPVFRPAFGATR